MSLMRWTLPLARPADQIHAEQKFRRDQNLLQGETHAVSKPPRWALPVERQQGRQVRARDRPPIGLAGEFGENLFRASLFVAAAEDGTRKSSRGSVFRRPLASYGRPPRSCRGLRNRLFKPIRAEYTSSLKCLRKCKQLCHLPSRHASLKCDKFGIASGC